MSREFAQLTVLIITLLSLTTISASALDITGKSPTYLNTTMTPQWRLMPLKKAIDEIEVAIKKPCQRFSGITEIQDTPIFLHAKETMDVKSILLELGKSVSIVFTVSADGCEVATAEECLRKRVVKRNYELNDYDFFPPVTSINYSPLGFPADLDPTQNTNESYYSQLDPDSIIEYIMHKFSPGNWESDDADNDSWEFFVPSIEGRSTGTKVAFTHIPEIHKQIHDTLTVLANNFHHQKRWQITFGLIENNAIYPTGLVDKTQVATVKNVCKQPVVLTLSGEMGQLVQSSSSEDHGHPLLTNFIDNQLTPQQIVVTRGRKAAIRAEYGLQYTMLSANLSWVEECDKTTTTVVRTPPHTTTKTTETDESGKEKVTVIDRDGEQIVLEVPVLWTWRPALDCFLPIGKSLILSSEHPRGQAIIIVEELP